MKFDLGTLSRGFIKILNSREKAIAPGQDS